MSGVCWQSPPSLFLQMVEKKMTARKTTGGTAVSHPIKAGGGPTPFRSQPPPPSPVEPLQDPVKPPIPIMAKIQRAAANEGGTVSQGVDFVRSYKVYPGFQLTPYISTVRFAATAESSSSSARNAAAQAVQAVFRALKKWTREFSTPWTIYCPSCHGRRQIFYVRMLC